MREITIDTGDVELRCQLAEPPGAVTAPLVIAAHGFPDCENSYRHQLGPLTEAGFRVLVPTMRGYAPSGVPRSGRYHAEALGRDLVALAEQLGEGEPVRLVGHDWGAVAVYAAAALAPERFSHLVAMAVPHLRVAATRWLRPTQLRRSWYMGMFQLRGVAERRLLRDDLALVERLWRDWSPGYRCEPEPMRRIKDAIAPRASEVLGYYRELLPRWGSARADARLVLSRCAVPALYLHGADDGCVGPELSRDLDDAFSHGVERHVLAGAGHFLHLEVPERVNALIVEFFASSPVRSAGRTSPSAR